MVGRNAIPRVKAEYQFTRSIFFRVVGEYNLSEHDDLRDETRTFFPLIINGSKALATRSAAFRGDWLFSYQPNPGTVLFLGYGSQADRGPESARAIQLPTARAVDGLFLREVQLLVQNVAHGWRPTATAAADSHGQQHGNDTEWLLIVEQVPCA
jgi:hypothetical protein